MRSFQEITAGEAKRIKYVLCDIDDTITKNGKMTERSYSALWKLHRSGISVIPVTGRPAGWCDLIIRQWPVEAVVGENGAFVYYYDSNGELKTFTHPDAIEGVREKFALMLEKAMKEVPGCRAAKDQFSRKYDLAIDFREDEPYLSISDAEKIKSICESFGAIAKISSIHVNTWFGQYNKVSMAQLFMHKILKEDSPEEESIFFGDSPNDEPMFSAFPMSCAVANINQFADKMSYLPPFVTEKPSADGFADAVDIILERIKQIEN